MLGRLLIGIVLVLGASEQSFAFTAAERYLMVLNVARVPGAPTIGTATATAGGGCASITFTAPADPGSSPITSYTATSSPSSIIGSGASSPVTVCGLTPGTNYTFTVKATNSTGTGPASGVSNGINPYGVISSTDLLLHFDSSLGSGLTFTDATGKTITRNTTSYNTSTADYVFGGSSLHGTSASNYLSATDSRLTTFTGDFTIEFWAKVTSTSLIFFYDINTTPVLQIYSTGGAIGGKIGSTTASQVSGFTSNVWHHVAFVRSGGNYKIYLDGVGGTAYANSSTCSATTAWIMSLGGADGLLGYVDELRVLNGTAYYLNNFTPSGPFTVLP